MAGRLITGHPAVSSQLVIAHASEGSNNSVFCREIREATTSMTSVPKPLKFLRPHYERLKDAHTSMKDTNNKKKLADVLSVLAITTGKEGERESLKYRLLGTKVRLSRQDFLIIKHSKAEQ